MKKHGGLKKHYVRTTILLKTTLEQVLSSLRASGPFVNRRGYLSQEVVVNASWLWMADMDPEELARELAPYVARVEAAWPQGETNESPETDPPETDPPVTFGTDEGPKRKRKRSRPA